MCAQSSAPSHDLALDRLTDLAALVTGADVAVVSLVATDRSVATRAKDGSEPPDANDGTWLLQSLSQHVVLADAPLVVPDAREHPVLRHHPAVEEHGVVAYASLPLHGADSSVLGALSVASRTVRPWTTRQLEMLAGVRATIEAVLPLVLHPPQDPVPNLAHTTVESAPRHAAPERARDAFVATAAHELRTPLTAILGYTDLLTDGAAGRLSEAQLELLDRVDRNGERLLTIVDDLVALSDLDPAPGPELAPMDANSAAQRSWEDLQPILAGRRLLAHLVLSDTSPQIVGDAAQVERVLLNLLRNAVAFTPDGGAVRLTVRDTPSGVEFEVTDTGIGVPEAEMAFLFEPFFRTRQARGLAIPGAGIGLSVARRIVEAHEGQLDVTSEPGIGTVVVVALPAARGAAPAPSGRRDLEADLDHALEAPDTQLVVHYQPVVDLTSGKVVAVESLLRWQHPLHGLLDPEEFIPLAEATGQIHRLGSWALDRAAHDAAALTHQGRDLDVAVNLSALQLDDDTVRTVERVLERSGLRAERLTLEVTESAFVHDQTGSATIYAALSRLGVKIAVDDFGTGYSSLPRLRRQSIDVLKIDRSLVAGIGVSVDDEAVCSSIIQLAGAIGADTVGEGIETTAQCAVLRSLGCLRGQGFLWSRAVPIEELGAAFQACDEVAVAAPRSPMRRAPDELPPEVLALIARMHADRASTHTMAGALNRTFGRHPKGMRWTAGAVARVLGPIPDPVSRSPR